MNMCSRNSIKAIVAALLCATSAYAAELALHPGMSREEVLYVHGRPKSKIEMETSRIEKWVFSYDDVLVFKNGSLVGKQRWSPMYAVELKKTLSLHRDEKSRRKPLKKVTKTESTAIFKELEGISEAEIPDTASPAAITQNTRKQGVPHPVRPIVGDDAGEDSDAE